MNGYEILLFVGHVLSTEKTGPSKPLLPKQPSSLSPPRLPRPTQPSMFEKICVIWKQNRRAILAAADASAEAAAAAAAAAEEAGATEAGTGVKAPAVAAPAPGDSSSSSRRRACAIGPGQGRHGGGGGGKMEVVYYHQTTEAKASITCIWCTLCGDLWQMILVADDSSTTTRGNFGTSLMVP